MVEDEKFETPDIDAPIEPTPDIDAPIEPVVEPEVEPEPEPEAPEPEPVDEKENEPAEPFDETPTKYKVIGAINIIDGQGQVQGQYPIGTVHEFAKTLGDIYVKEGAAEEVEK